MRKEDQHKILLAKELIRKYKENPLSVKGGQIQKQKKKIIGIENIESDQLFEQLHQIVEEIRRENREGSRYKEIKRKIQEHIRRYSKNQEDLSDKTIREYRKTLYQYAEEDETNKLLAEIIQIRKELRKEKRKFIQRYQPHK